MQKTLIASLFVLILASCGSGRIDPNEIQPYKGEPYIQRIPVIGGNTRGYSPAIVKGTCSYTFGNIQGTINLPGSLVLPMTDQRQELNISCSGKLVNPGRLNLFKNSTYVGKEEVMTSQNRGVLSAGNARYRSSKGLLSPEEREVIIKSRGVQILPSIIGVEMNTNIFNPN